MAVLKLFEGFGQRGAEPASEQGSVAVITPADSRRRLEILDDFEQAGIGWLWATDSDCRLIYISENAVEKLERPITDLLGQSLHKLFETDPDSTSGKSDRPLNFQLTARNKIVDLTVRFTSRPDGKPGGQSRRIQNLTNLGNSKAIAVAPRTSRLNMNAVWKIPGLPNMIR
jgi:hypothetical protein